MELLYVVQKKNNREQQLFSNKKQLSICTVSTRNIIAYTQDRELVENASTFTTGFYVYVADLNCPWLSYKVAGNKYPITVLEWDIIGRYLLIGDIVGNVQIWTLKDNLLSEWTKLGSARFPGEHIIRASFFHNGRKVSLQTDKKDLSNYLEKYPRVKFSPSCRSFGGVPNDGVLVVTATGLVGTFLIPADSSTYNRNNANQNTPQTPQIFSVTSRSLTHTRNFITIADICCMRNGSFYVATANGDSDDGPSTMIHCYRVNVEKKLENLTLVSQALPSFFLNAGSGRDVPGLKITHLQWMANDETESLLVGSKSLSGSFLESWNLIEKPTQIHSYFKQNFQQPNKNEVFKTAVWTHQMNYRYSSRIAGVCTSKFQYCNSSYIFVSMSDNTIHCLHRDTLKRLMNASLTCVWRSESDSLSKQSRTENALTAHDISWMGHLLMAVDSNGQLYGYRVTYPHQDTPGGQGTISYAISLLEYCLISGYDALDVFLILKVQQLDTIIDRLSENFMRQPTNTQQFYYVNFFATKANLYRLSIPGQPKAYDLTCFLMLHSILIGFKSLLRPSGLSSHDKGPAENLAMVLSESVPADIDKVLLGLEAKEFTVEASTLQSLQQLIQWVADLALNILAKLPDNRGMAMNRNTGYDISKDIVALNSIRELLVMMRIWGLVRLQCLPVFNRSAENLDVLATLFRLLTRLTLNPNDPDEHLLDECYLLPSQVLIPQLQNVTSQYSLASPILFYLTNNNFPMKFDYNIEPQNLKFTPDIGSIESGFSGEQISDSIRHIQLGKRPGTLRRCTRCGAYTSLNSVAKTAAMRAWEQRWASGCRCGGLWRLQV